MEFRIVAPYRAEIGDQMILEFEPYVEAGTRLCSIHVVPAPGCSKLFHIVVERGRPMMTPAEFADFVEDYVACKGNRLQAWIADCDVL